MHHRRSLCFTAAIVAAILVMPLAPSRPSQATTWSVPNTGRSATTAADEAAERNFVVMRPGWHVYAGPGGLLWDPGRFASGNYAVKSTIYLFPEGDPGTLRVNPRRHALRPLPGRPRP